jgi:G6PDH family F420-dependent oxidoreductase
LNRRVNRISDHFHPWNDEQGESPFVWSMLSALSQVCRLPVTTAVTCPKIRIHPTIVAQAAATSALLLPGRFTLGVGTGEALNEHVAGARFPTIEQRLEMLEEAVTVIRRLWTEDFVTHHGAHYTVENARIYTKPETPPRIFVSGFGAKSAEVAARIGDGYITTTPDRDTLATFRTNGGAGKPTQAGYKVCWGNDIDRHVAAFQPYADAGFDEIYVSQMGGREKQTNIEGFFEFYARSVLPKLQGSRSSSVTGAR